MSYDVGTMVLSTPYYVGTHEQVVGWVIKSYKDYCVVQWASDMLPISMVMKSEMYWLQKAYRDLSTNR